MAEENSTGIWGIILMGVSGCGKTTVGKLLAKRLGWMFIESDNYHSTEHVHKMAKGIPLNDVDRQPWLETLHEQLSSHHQNNQSVVLACSALKERYRDTLRGKLPGLRFVFLEGGYELINTRMRSRSHFMKADMLQSQFNALEIPREAYDVDIRENPGTIVGQIVAGLGLAELTK